MATDETLTVPPPQETAPNANPLRNVALTVVLLALILFVLSVFMERRTPSSSQAQVQAYVVGIAPEVTGRVVEVNVTDNALVEPEQVLFRIDPARFQIAVTEAEAALARVGQSIGASTAQVDAVQARLVQAQASRDNAGEQLGRATELTKRGVYAKTKLDEAQLEFDQAQAAVTAAEADLVSAQANLGPAGNDNPELKQALAALERAQLDLLRTTARAPSTGVVTNLQLSIGKVVSAGQSAMTFIDVGTVWIAAAFKENSPKRLQWAIALRSCSMRFRGRYLERRSKALALAFRREAQIRAPAFQPSATTVAGCRRRSVFQCGSSWMRDDQRASVTVHRRQW